MKVKGVFKGRGGTARLAAGLLLVGTAASQHPNPSFNRIGRLDIFSAMFPNWRFFAPEPAQHDYHIFYRTLNEEGDSSSWKSVDVIAGRKARQIGWFPGRRPEKALFDICSELLSVLDKSFDEITRLPSYRLLREFMRTEVNSSGTPAVKGFQFALAKYTGYDDSSDVQIIFTSPYTPIV
jgi:hypothetical protein